MWQIERNERIRKEEMNRAQISNDPTKRACGYCRTTGIIGYTTISQPEIITCNHCNGKGYT